MKIGEKGTLVYFYYIINQSTNSEMLHCWLFIPCCCNYKLKPFSSVGCGGELGAWADVIAGTAYCDHMCRVQGTIACYKDQGRHKGRAIGTLLDIH